MVTIGTGRKLHIMSQEEQ